MAHKTWWSSGEIDNGGRLVSGERFGRAATWIGGGEKNGADGARDCRKKGVAWDAKANGIEVIIIKVAKIGVFGQNQCEFAGEVSLYEWSCIRWNDAVARDGGFGFWY